MKNRIITLAIAALAVGALVAPASASATRYLSKSEACDVATEVVQDDFDAWRVYTDSCWVSRRARAGGPQRSDRLYVAINFERQNARLGWSAYIRVREYRTHYTYTTLSASKMGPRW